MNRQPAERGVQGRPSTAEVMDPQAVKEAKIRTIFREQAKLLAALFPKDGDTMVARAVASAIMASRARDKKTGKLSLESISPEMIAERCIAAHHMGLEPGSECYLIPYGGDLQLQTGPQGLVKLMMQSGFVRKIEARAVRQGDFFEYDLGDEGYIRHRKGERNRDNPVSHAYAFIETTTGGKIREVCTVDDLEYYRSLSKMKDGGPMWLDHYEGACRKTMIHRIAEFVPRSPVLSAALRSNEMGGIEIPEEIMAAVRKRLVDEVKADMGMGGSTPVAEPMHVAAEQAPEPGSAG